jgi:A/G-specific adenine glycosylase
MAGSKVPHPQWVRAVRRKLLAFFTANRRDLPWRRTRDPYRVWVSEVMLQQTRVDVVIPYYERWLEQFPTIDDLAAASTDDVLRVWQGLGYYRRARNLHHAARVVRERHHGTIPDTVAGLLALPGVGLYTAGAVASICFGRPEPAVDGNARRVLCRLLDAVDIAPSALNALAAALVPAGRPGDFNQALMELGATVCTPRSPRCASCPVSSECAARAAGTQHERPARRRPADIPSFDVGSAVLFDGNGRVLLTRRPENGLLAGLWEFPAAIVQPAETARAAARRALAGLGLRVAPRAGRMLGLVPHVFSHRREHYHVFRYTRRTSAPASNDENVRWIAPRDVDSVTLPAAQQRIAALAFSTRPPAPPRA